MGEYAEYGFDQQGWYGMFVACGIWCLADVSSVSPSSEQTDLIRIFYTRVWNIVFNISEKNSRRQKVMEQNNLNKFMLIASN